MYTIKTAKEKGAFEIVNTAGTDKEAWTRPGCVIPNCRFTKGVHISNLDAWELIRSDKDINSLNLTIYEAYALGLMTQEAADDLKLFMYSDPDLPEYMNKEDVNHIEGLDDFRDIEDDYWLGCWGDEIYSECPNGGFDFCYEYSR